jgi:hypothetical protein
MTYKLNSLDTILQHWPETVQLIHDGNKNADLDAQVASDEYFALIATRLDQVSQSLKDAQHSDYIILEQIIKDLLYLQQNYAITKK